MDATKTKIVVRVKCLTEVNYKITNMKTKIFYMGRRINGKFDSFKAKVRRFARWCVRWSLISATAYAIFMAGAFLYSTSSVTASVTDSMPQRLEELKSDVVAKISKCEAAGHKEDDGIIIFDSNAKASIGQMQFQVKTVQHYYKTLYGQDITPKEAVLIALDEQKAKALAKDIMFTSNNGATDWLNCATKLGVGPEIAVIKKLSK